MRAVTSLECAFSPLTLGEHCELVWGSSGVGRGGRCASSGLPVSSGGQGWGGALPGGGAPLVKKLVMWV
jgi:hypothetical protein